MNRVQPPTDAARDLPLWTFLCVGLFQGILLSETWGRWTTVGALCALSVLRGGVTLLGTAWLKRPERRVLGTWLLLVGNLLISTAVSELLHWNLLAWFNVLFQVLFLNGLADPVGHSSMLRFGLGAYLTASSWGRPGRSARCS
ncbi:hypothetical protein [Archangium violaceum]|uniref:hypothetical protein n=1 Tax=Archangium violaceum TaxID=83451 RepID=UPI001EF02F66|nr:hypothetical protein [Archangium violaceum]